MATAAAAKTPAQLFALVFGVVYLLVGIVGFAVTGFDDFATFSTDELIVFHLNPLHNIVHIALGAVWIAVSSQQATAKMVNLLFGIVLAVVALVGFVEIESLSELVNLQGAGEPDNWLHVVTAALAIYFGTAGAQGSGAGAA